MNRFLYEVVVCYTHLNLGWHSLEKALSHRFLNKLPNAGETALFTVRVMKTKHKKPLASIINYGDRHHLEPGCRDGRSEMKLLMRSNTLITASFLLLCLSLLPSSISASVLINESFLFKGHETWVNDIALADKNELYSVSNDGSLIVWDRTSRLPKRRFFLDMVSKPRGKMRPNIYTVSLNKDGTYYAITASDGYLRVYDRATDKEIWKDKVRYENAYALEFVDNTHLLMGDIAGVVAFIDITRKEVVYEIDAHMDAINGIAVFSDAKKFVTVSNDSLIKIWDISGALEKTLKGHKDSILAVAVSADNKRLVTGSRDKTARLWDMATGSNEVIHKDFSYVGAVAFSPDGALVTFQDHINNITVMELLYDSELFRLEGHGSKIKEMVFSNDSSRLYSCSTDASIREWKLARK